MQIFRSRPLPVWPPHGRQLRAPWGVNTNWRHINQSIIILYNINKSLDSITGTFPADFTQPMNNSLSTQCTWHFKVSYLPTYIHDHNERSQFPTNSMAHAHAVHLSNENHLIYKMARLNAVWPVPFTNIWYCDWSRGVIAARLSNRDIAERPRRYRDIVSISRYHAHCSCCDFAMSRQYICFLTLIWPKID